MKLSLTVFNPNRSYCEITCHFIDNEWNLQSFVKDFKPPYEKHSSKGLTRLIFDALKSLHIENEIQGITTDSAFEFFFLKELKILIKSDFKTHKFLKFFHQNESHVTYYFSAVFLQTWRLVRQFSVKWVMYNVYCTLGWLDYYWTNISFFHCFSDFFPTEMTLVVLILIFSCFLRRIL